MAGDEPATDVAAMQHELSALRDRNQELERLSRQNPSRSHRFLAACRSTTVVVLLVLGTLCATLAPVTVWGRNLVLNTDRYVATLRPVAANPGVQNLVINAVDKQVAAHVDLHTLVAQTLPPKATVLAAPLQTALESLINTVTTKFVHSPAFVTLWSQMNRGAHQQIVYLLTGKNPTGSAVVLNNQGKVVLQLAPIVEQVKSRLVAAGLTVAKNIPAVGATIVIGQAKGLTSARRAVRALNTIADVLPWLALALFAGAIATAKRRRHAVTVAALATAGGMVLISLLLLVVRRLYLDQIDPATVPRDTAQYLFDTLVRFLRDGIRVIFAVAIVIVVVAWVTGPASYPVRLRHRVASAPRYLANVTEHGPVGRLAVEHTRGCRIGVVAVALIVLVFFVDASLESFLVLAAMTVVLLLAVEALRVGNHRSATGSRTPHATG
jgi:hypothetical protein